MPLAELAIFALIGLLVAIYGSIIGAGGGFIIVPTLLLFFSNEFTTPEAAGTSLFVVLLNGLAATFAFARQQRIDYRTGLAFATATVPSALLGGQVAAYFDSAAFKILFGALMLSIAILLNVRPDPETATSPVAPTGPLPAGFVRREHTDAHGQVFSYAFNLRNGIIFSFFIGFLAALLGIGGGIFMVPAMVFVFGFPAHLASATSSFVLIFTAIAGLIPHALNHHVHIGPALTMGLSGIIGAQIGAAIAQRIRGKAIVRSLSVAIVVVGLQLIRKALNL